MLCWKNTGRETQSHEGRRMISIFIIVFRKSEIKCKIIYLCETVIHEKIKANLICAEGKNMRERKSFCENFSSRKTQNQEM